MNREEAYAGDHVSNDDLLRPREVADMFKVSTMTVYRLVRDGHLDSIRIGRSLRIRRVSVMRLLGELAG